MSNALKDLFQEQADAIREGLGNIGGIAPNETPALIREIVSMIGTGGGGGGGTGSGLKFATGTFSTKTTGIYRQTITHGLGVMPDFVMVYVDAVLIPSTTAEVIEKCPLQCVWGLHSKFASKAGVAGYYNFIGSAPDNNTAFLDVKKSDSQIYCPDDATFEFGLPSGTNCLLYEDMTYSWIAISGMATGGGSSADVRYVTFRNEATGEEFVKPVAVGDDCVDVVAKGLWKTPTKESDAQYHYTYYGWGAEDGGAADANILKNITEDKTVYAVFSKTLRSYTITWLDEDGTELPGQKQWAYGTVPSYTPTKDGYVFDGWTPTPVAVTGNASYTAVWDNVLASGSLNENTSWKLSADGTLTISGTGAMPNYNMTSSSDYHVEKSPLYEYRKQITRLVVEEGVTTVGERLLHSYYTKVTEIILPPGLTKIGTNAFSYCSGITEIDIPDSVTLIYENAFAGCSKLESIVIPSNVTMIGRLAFSGCTALASVTFENTDGWWVNASSTATSGEAVDVSDPATAATLLKSTHYSKYWRKS